MNASESQERVGLVEGTIIDGRYRIESELGRGGFARIYHAEHVDLGRPVALKVIELPQSPGAVDTFIQRFLREARIAANLNHPNVVTVYDYGVVEETGQPYLAMEFLDGWDLEMRLAHEGSYAPEQAVQLICDVLDALDMAQRQGIVHKDLKPSNLFVVDRGTPRERLILIDFGIARLYTDEGSRITQTGGFAGTPAYFAPEYVKHQIVTPAIDVYQSALILCEMMTGHPLVVADHSMQYLLKHSAGDFDIPKELRTSPLGPVLERALAIDHTERYPDCGAFRRALEELDVRKMAPLGTTLGPVVRSDSLEHTPNTGDFASGPTSDVVVRGGSVDSAADVSGPAETSDDTRQRTMKTVILAVGMPLALCGLVAVVWGGFYLATGADEQPERKAPPTTEAKAPALPATPAEPEPPVRTFEINSVPHGATVRVDGELIGETPLTLEDERVTGEGATVELRREGFAPLSVRTKLAAGGGIAPELEPTPDESEDDAEAVERAERPQAKSKRKKRALQGVKRKIRKAKEKQREPAEPPPEKTEPKQTDDDEYVPSLVY